MSRIVAGVGAPISEQVVTTATAENNAPYVTTEVYGGTLAAGGVGSTVSLILNGVTYKQDYDTDAATTAGLLATACGSGTYDKWSSTVSGGNAVGTETVTLTIPGDTGGDVGTGVWTYNPAAGRTNAQMAGDLRTLIGTTFPSSLYNVSGGSTAISLTKKTRGVGVTPVWTADGALAISLTHSIVGVAGQTDWTVTDLAAVFTITHATAGATADTVSSAVTGTFTLTVTETTIGWDALAATAGASLAASQAGVGSIEALLNAGTSYVLEIWQYDGTTWVKDMTFNSGTGTATVNASAIYNFTPSGSQVYAYVKTFVGGADATVLVKTQA